MPALNEEGSLGAAVASVEAALRDRVSAFEILIFNDGSADRTGVIAEELARQNPRIQVIHNGYRMGVGYNYARGVELARHEYVVMIPSDNEVSEDSIRELVNAMGTADLVIAYFVNPWVRPWRRRIVSKAFVWTLDCLFGLRLRYYNGPCIIRTRLIRAIAHYTRGFAYMAAIVVQLLKKGHSFVEVGVRLSERKSGQSKAFSIRNVLSVVRTVLSLFWGVRLKDWYHHRHCGIVRAADQTPRRLQ